MPTVFTHTKVLAPAQAAERLAEEIARQFRHEPAHQIIRIEAPIEAIDPIEWLAAQTSSERVYWSDRERRFADAGVGVAATLEQKERMDTEGLFARVRAMLGEQSEARFYGGMRFDDRREAGVHWKGFGAARFVLPRFEVMRRGGETVLAVNVNPSMEESQRDEVLAQLKQLRWGPAESGGKRALTAHQRADTPSRERWMATVAAAVEEIRVGRMEKIVLARESRFELAKAPEPVKLAGMLEAAAPGCFVFCHQLSDGAAFLGATPERLYYRTGRHIESEALAGTRRRGETEEEDARLGEKLLSSRKETREQGFVADAVRGMLLEFCCRLEGGEKRELVKLARVQHMVTRFAGELEPDVSDADLVTRLHPTPAVGGVPTEAAKERIRALEAFDRGWYAGPIGWIGADSAEFAVGIRSALLKDTALRLYSGAGIVEGSHPDKEWDEIENKIDNFLKLLASQ